MNNRQTRRQVFALAGTFQAIYLVNEIAKRGVKQKDTSQIILQSLWVFRPETTFEIYQNNHLILKDGYKTIVDILSGNNINSNINSYFLEILKRSDDVLENNIISDSLCKKLKSIQIEENNYLSENVLNQISQIQIQFSKQYPKPIQIHGDKTHLSNSYNINLIRSLLFASMRGALLWRQLGGSKIHLLFKRGQIIEIAQKYIS